MAEPHLHVIVWAAEGKTDSGYSGVTYIDLLADSIEMALVRAKAICPGRPYYWPNSVVEHHDHES